MSKSKNRGPAPSPKTISILIARAGGRCQFENCNKNIFLDEVTLDDTNDSNVAHIIASSPKGPRGSQTLSFAMSDKIENLMLMCLDHHHLIDEKGREHIYTVERLNAMKASQEERVQKLMDNLNADVTMMLHLTSPIKGKQSDSFSAREAAKAFLPRMRAESEYAMTISVPAFGEYRSEEYWQKAEQWLDNHFCYTVRSKVNNCPNTHLSVFPLAPIPLIVKLGFLMGDKMRANVYQKTKQLDTWEWQSTVLTNDFKVEEKTFESGVGIAIVLSVTAEIEMEAVLKVATFKTVYILRADRQGDESIKSEQDLSAFWHKYKELCESLKGKEELSVFPAVPVSAAFEMGRRYMVGVYPKMVIYDRDGDFFETLTIGD
ncbi:MAG: SAVED domain-containing protein [Clostridia bacterium]|nr:SAVED domain-containing protein [Clostridia bacterium]